MKKFLPLLLLLFAMSANGQTKMCDVFASAPDSIFPLLTKNNRLDCIDFIENNMPARVKNRFDENSELKALTSDYLLLQVTPVSTVEMKMLPREAAQDTILCIVRTYLAPVADSEVTFCDLRWNDVSINLEHRVEEVISTCGLDEDDTWILRELPLVRATLSAEEPTLTYELQTGELNKEQRERVAGKLSPVVLRWNGTSFVK